MTDPPRRPEAEDHEPEPLGGSFPAPRRTRPVAGIHWLILAMGVVVMGASFYALFGREAATPGDEGQALPSVAAAPPSEPGLPVAAPELSEPVAMPNLELEPAIVEESTPGDLDVFPGGMDREKALSGAYTLQLGSLRERQAADALWGRLRSEYPDLLGDLSGFVMEADLGDRGVFHRVRVGPFADLAAARRRCEGLKALNVDCLAVRN